MDEELGKEPERPSNFRLPLTPPAKRSSYKPILITLLCAGLLGAGTCFGFANTFNLNRKSSLVPMVFAAAFIGCVLTFIGSLIWAFVRFLQNANRGN
jgi:phage shock protein PspC (stress-responsive transcriptional regulator)